MEDASDLKVDEATLNLEGIDQIKENIVEVFDSTKDAQDNGSFENNISIKEEESIDEVVKEADLEKPQDIADVSESVSELVVADASLNEQIEESEASVETQVISDAKPDDNSKTEWESLVETDNVGDKIQESSTASSYVNDSAAATNKEDKELASLAVDDNETPGFEASPTAVDILEAKDDCKIPPLEANLGAKETEDTQLEVLDSSKKELSGPFYIELDGNADDASQPTGADAPVVDSSNDDGNKPRTIEMSETKPAAVVFERKPCWASLLGCCGLSEAFHLSGR